ncbi:hypothetical protein ANN_27749 [Periplaneta americana]|uniref:Mos1 transposase HTH domain-containing protein n=1 Tax=Periplaneta americana TaxID=6978 RepID=A0ABQ8RV55_PERAM|nr:hypothetical protein ANN_27749 [Periplaneta americana]
MFKVIEHHADCEMQSVIRFLNARNIKPADIHHQLCEVYGDDAINDGMVRRWVRKFNEGRISVHDEQHTGRPSLINDDLLRAVDEKIHEDRRFTISSLSLNFPQMLRSGSQEGEFYNEGIERLVPRLDKCLNNGGDYVVMDVNKMEPGSDPLAIHTSNAEIEEKEPLSEEGNLLDLDVTKIKTESIDHRYDVKSEIQFEETSASVDFPMLKSEAEEGNLLDLHVTSIKEVCVDDSYEHNSEIRFEEIILPNNVVKCEAEEDAFDLDKVQQQQKQEVSSEEDEVSTESIKEECVDDSYEHNSEIRFEEIILPNNVVKCEAEQVVSYPREVFTDHRTTAHQTPLVSEDLASLPVASRLNYDNTRSFINSPLYLVVPVNVLQL